MILPVMCDFEMRKKWEEQSKLKKWFYSSSTNQLQFAGIITLQFNFFAKQVWTKL